MDGGSLGRESEKHETYRDDACYYKMYWRFSVNVLLH